MAPSTRTAPSATLIVTLAPLRVFAAGELDHVGRRHRAGDDVVEEDLAQLGRIRREGLERRRRHLREGGVGRGEDGERPAARERVGEAGLLEQRGERGELPGGDGRLDDVAVRGGPCRCTGADCCDRERGDGGDCEERSGYVSSGSPIQIVDSDLRSRDGRRHG